MFYPYLTLWTYGFMVWLIGLYGTIIISTVIFPIISFYLLYKICSRQLDKLWSIAISLTNNFFTLFLLAHSATHFFPRFLINRNNLIIDDRS